MQIRPLIVSLLMLAVVSSMPRLGAAQEIGVLKGFNSSTVGFEGVNVSADRRGGIAGGKYYSHVIQGMFAVELDALLAMKGTEFDFGQGDSGKAKLIYLDIPVLARVNIPASAAARVHLLAGPSFNFKLSGSFDRENAGGDGEIKIFETALVIGGGVTVKRVRIDARYGWGLTNIAKEEGFTAKNRVFSILLGVVLKKGPGTAGVAQPE